MTMTMTEPTTFEWMGKTYENLEDVPEALLPHVDMPQGRSGTVLQALTPDEITLAKILMDRSGIDLVEMIFVDDSKATRCYRLRPFQWRWWRCMDPLQLDQGCRSVGKALALDTPIPTRHGWKAMGDIWVGDWLFDMNGRPTRVTEAFDVQIDRPCYRVEFDVGEAIVADADHLWVTKGGVLTTLQLGPGHLVPLAGNLHRPNPRQQKLPVAPYTLGAWLGDGSSFRAHLTAHGKDGAFIIDQIRADGYEVSPLGTEFAFSIKTPGQAGKNDSVTGALRHLGVLRNKHIPQAYLRAGTSRRRALLQGIMDTDGHITRRGTCEITLKSERLARDVYELAASLRQKPSFAEKRATIDGRDCGPVYRVTFHAQRLVPFRLPRKANRVRRPKRNEGTRRVAAVTPVQSVPVRCIAVDSTTRTFLAGRSMIPTHNSESIIAQACAFPFNYPIQEFVIVTPEGSHADALTERFEARLFSTRLMKEMLAGGRRSGVTHHPFQALFENGSRIFVRLPQRSGIGVKGIHPVVLHIDEAQDVSERTWNELPAVVRTDVPGHMTRAHGVSKGVQDDSFAKKSAPGSGWTVHRITRMHEPNLEPYTFTKPDGTLDDFTTNDDNVAAEYAKTNGYTLNENWRTKRAREYGGRESPDFKRNEYGVHGDAMNRIFILTRLMATVDTNEASAYNLDEYRRYAIKADAIAQRAESRSGREHNVEVYDDEQANAITEMVQLPLDHINDYDVFWMGMDVGVIGDPSEILVFAEHVPDAAQRAADRAVGLRLPKGKLSQFRLVARVQLLNVAPDLQAHLIMHLINHYKPKAFSLDRTGNGIGILRALQRLAGTSRVYVLEQAETADAIEQGRAKAALTTIKGYNFSEKVIIAINEQIVEQKGLTDPKEILEKAGVRQHAKDAATDVLRELVDTGRIRLPYDPDVINQFNGQTWQTAQEPIDQYGRQRKIYSRGEFHLLDAGRMFALGQDLQPIEAIIAAIDKPAPPVRDRFGL